MKKESPLILTFVLAICVLRTCRGAECPLECSSCDVDPVSAELKSVTCTGYSPGRLDTSVKVALLSDMTLRGVNLQKFLFAGKVNLEYIQLENFGIEDLASDVFDDATGLTTLDLSANKLTQITNSTFKSAPGLQELILDNNNINIVDDSAFAGITPQLQGLSLAHNRLSNLTLDMFFGLSSLVQLDLSYNILETIHTAALSRIPTLRSLDLSGNQLVTLDSRPFSTLTSLSIIDLSRNLLASIATDAFLDTVISDVDLSKNLLSSIPSKTLDVVKNTLVSLKLSTNAISTLDPNVLNGYNLTLLDIGNNTLQSLDVLAFNGTVINSLHLENNDLSALASGLGSFLTSCTHVYLSGNPWLCDCDSVWLLQSVRDSPSKYPPINGTVPSCSSTSLYPDRELKTTADSLERDCLKTTTTITPGTECPVQCSVCEHDSVSGAVIKVECAGIGAEILPNTVEEATLSQYQVPGGVLERDTFVGKVNLTSLKLDSYYFETFAMDIFRDNVRLEVIHITNSGVTHLADNMFASLASLEYLKLYGNKINEIRVDAFRGLDRLKDLDLHNNSIGTFHSRAIPHSPVLTVLSCSDNKLTSLGDNMFSTLPSLQNLRLFNNLIDNISDSAFANTSLERLNLGNNQLTVYPTKALLPTAPTLKYLQLHRNSITTLDASTCAGMTLNDLQLARNAIATIADSAFKDCSVRSMYLNDNRLTKVPLSFMNVISRVTEMYLSDNPWICDCETMWFAEFIGTLNVQKSADLVCFSPTEYAGVSLVDFAGRLATSCPTTTAGTTAAETPTTDAPASAAADSTSDTLLTATQITTTATSTTPRGNTTKVILPTATQSTATATAVETTTAGNVGKPATPTPRGNTTEETTTAVNDQSTVTPTAPSTANVISGSVTWVKAFIPALAVIVWRC